MRWLTPRYPKRGWVTPTWEATRANEPQVPATPQAQAVVPGDGRTRNAEALRAHNPHAARAQSLRNALGRLPFGLWRVTTCY